MDYDADFPMRELFKIVNNPTFLRDVPKYSNSRETWANIQLIKSSLILYRRQYLTLSEISNAVKSFTLAARETKVGERIELHPVEINKALRLLDRSMGDVVINEWIKRCHSSLECNQNSKRLLYER